MALTPSQRRAKLEAAKALMNEVETDETVETPVVHKSGAPDRQPAAPTVVTPPSAPVSGLVMQVTAPLAQARPAAVLPQALPTPHSDAIAAGQPSLFSTLMSVAKLGWGKTQKG